MQANNHPFKPSAPFTQIDEDILKLAVPLPYVNKEINSYLIKGDRGYTVIDTGDHTEDAKDFWKKLISQGLAIEKIVVTHAHPDHFGLCHWFQETYQIPIVLSKRTYQKIQEYKNPSEWLKKTYIFCHKHGFPEIPAESLSLNGAAYSFEPDELFNQEGTIQLGNGQYEIIHTPGHSEDHVCFYHPEKRMMIIGDQVLPGISPIVGVLCEEDGNPLKDYFLSLKKLQTYDVKLALPGHGDAIEQLQQRIDEIISGHERRMKQITESVKQEEKTAFQLATEIYGSGSLPKMINPFGATLARCIYLESIGSITSKTSDNKIVFTVS